MHTDQITTIVWDEGDRGVSPSMFREILNSVNMYTQGKTLICITHCVSVKDMDIWDHKLSLDKE